MVKDAAAMLESGQIKKIIDSNHDVLIKYLKEKVSALYSEEKDDQKSEEKK